jgi:hypothetical protein
MERCLSCLLADKTPDTDLCGLCLDAPVLSDELIEILETIEESKRNI